MLCSLCTTAQIKNNKRITPPYPPQINEVVLKSNNSIISKIGKVNFETWVDSMVVAEIPFNNGCQGTHRPCDPIPPKLSDIGRIGITYFFNIPRYGNYVNSNYAYQGEKNTKVYEDHAIFPNCTKYPFKCKFLKKDSLLKVAQEILMIDASSQLRTSNSYYYSGNFAFLFETGRGSLIISANTGQILKYNYFGPTSSYDCSVIQKCSLNDAWLEAAKEFLRVDDSFKLIDNSPQKYGVSCSWQFTSEKAYLILNGKDGKVLSYINYTGPEE